MGFMLAALATGEIPSVNAAPIAAILKPDFVPKNLRDYDDKPIAILMEVEKQREIYALRPKATQISASSFLPNRVYLYYLPKEQRWHQVLTDGYGKLNLNPLEVLRASTTLPGSSVGAKNPSQRYMLGHDKLWLPTFKKERYEFWVTSNPPLAKYVEFEPLAKPTSPEKSGEKK